MNKEEIIQEIEACYNEDCYQYGECVELNNDECKILLHYIQGLEYENEQLQQKVNQLEEKEELHLNRIDELTDRVVNSKSVLDEIRKIVSKSVFKTDLVELCGMKNEIKEILNKVGGSNE